MERPVVRTFSGALRGRTQTNIVGDNFYSFKGIPYAKAPINDLRFQDPIPVEPWQGVRDASEFGSECIQHDVYSGTLHGSEDCLYLNVYTKELKSNLYQPVIAWIHGGGFTWGSGDDAFYGPDYFLKKNIVLVTINYRLGVFGFLNLEDEIAPGNQGLKDQVMALKWIRANIEYFGGNPNNVTIFGESSGGASVHFLTLSDLANGLFHKAIAHSGVALNPWAIVPNPKKYAVRLCALLGKKAKTPKQIFRFLSSIDPQSIIKAQSNLIQPVENLQNIYPFGPGVDCKSANPFLPISIESAVKKGVSVPFLLGYMSREGIIYLAERTSEVFKKINNNFENYLHPYILRKLEEYDLTSNDLRYWYYGSENISKNNRETFADLWGDLHLIEGIHSVIDIQIRNASTSTYLYQFSYDRGHSVFKSKVGLDRVEGVAQFEQILYQFSSSFLKRMGSNPLESKTSYRIMEQIIELWTNFAETGTPTPSTSNIVPINWLPVIDSYTFRYLNIDKDLQMKKTLNINLRYS